MPAFSAFTPYGHLKYSRSPAHGQRIYEAIRRGLGGQFNDDFNGREMARVYATAIGIASLQYTLERAGNQADPMKATELLRELERDHGLVPAPGQSLWERRAILAARLLLPKGARRSNVEAALRLVLGDYFKAYHAIPSAAFLAVAPATSLHGAWKKHENARFKLIKLDTAISPGGPQIVVYTHVGGDAADIVAGDTIVVDGHRNGVGEAVLIQEAYRSTFAVGWTALVATFTKPHEAGAIGTTAPFPFWTSPQRRNLVVVDPAALADPEMKRIVNELLHRLLRCVSVWALVREESPGQAGPFKVGVGRVGTTPIGIVSY